MDFYSIKEILTKLFSKLTSFNYNVINQNGIPIGISNRHVHLSQNDLNVLFGNGYQLNVLKDLSQPGQYASKELVTIVGPKGSIENVRILGPVRAKTQVEVMKSDTFKLGVDAPVRDSGDLVGSSPITIVGPKGSVFCPEGLIIAKRHIHMSPSDAAQFNVKDKELVSASYFGDRGLVFNNVLIRVSDKFSLEAHLDMDEANCANIKNGEYLYLMKNEFGNSNNFNSGDITSDLPAQNTLASETNEKDNIIPVSLVTEDMVYKANNLGKDIYVTHDGILTPLAKDAVSKFNVNIIRMDEEE